MSFWTPLTIIAWVVAGWYALFALLAIVLLLAVVATGIWTAIEDWLRRRRYRKLYKGNRR